MLRNTRACLALILAATAMPSQAQLAARKAEEWVTTLEGPQRKFYDGLLESYRRLSSSFFAPLSFKPNSTSQEKLAREETGVQSQEGQRQRSKLGGAGLE